MCLNSVTKTRRPNDMMRVGYKLFVKKYVTSWNGRGYTLHNPYYNEDKKHCAGKAYSVPKEFTGQLVYSYAGSKWDGDQVVNANVYDIGFHIYSDKDDAFKAREGFQMSICKVMAWDIRAYGYQNKKKCFVARHYRIMEEEIEL